MTTYQPKITATVRQVDWPLLSFFMLAYAIAWGTFGIMAIIARQAWIALKH